MNQKNILKAVYTCILLSFFSVMCFAQSGNDSLFQKHWEIGLDVLSLFDKNNLPAASVFARKNYALKKGSGKAWRFRAGLDTEYYWYTSISRFIPDDRQVYSPYLSIGHEWQKKQERFRWFWGADAYGRFTHQNSFQLLSVSDSIVNDYRFRDLNTGISILLGFQFDVSSQIAVSLESTFTGNYHWYKITEETGKFGTPPGGFGNTRSRMFTTQVIPFNAIHLIYKFKTRHHEKNKNL